jgi:hypothetical protein
VATFSLVVKAGTLDEGARIGNSPEVVWGVNVGDEAGMDGCDRQAAVDDFGWGCAGKLPPVKEPPTSHFYLLNQVNFENHCVA